MTCCTPSEFQARWDPDACAVRFGSWRDLPASLHPGACNVKSNGKLGSIGTGVSMHGWSDHHAHKHAGPISHSPSILLPSWHANPTLHARATSTLRQADAPCSFDAKQIANRNACIEICVALGHPPCAAHSPR
eukprot:365157-Chlamydomonas_euryale.AAC.24